MYVLSGCSKKDGEGSETDDVAKGTVGEQFDMAELICRKLVTEIGCTVGDRHSQFGSSWVCAEKTLGCGSSQRYGPPVRRSSRRACVGPATAGFLERYRGDHKSSGGGTLELEGGIVHKG